MGWYAGPAELENWFSEREETVAFFDGWSGRCILLNGPQRLLFTNIAPIFLNFRVWLQEVYLID
jgi:hypothetical protein